MLGFLQGLRGSGSATEQLPGDIYSEFFADILREARESGCKPGDQETPQGFSMLRSFDTENSNQLEPPAATDEDVWIFGYGSLVWKADFPYIDRRRGFVWGFKRRFYQHSIDHRGIPERPGRVVTLLPGDPAEDRVYGVAYRIAASQKGAVLDHLDYREKNGYERCSLEFHEYQNTTAAGGGGDPIQVIMYVATQANDSYAGDVWQVPCIARQIFSSAGPSGPNREYLFNLAAAMEQLFPGAVDEHLEELVACVRRHIDEDEPQLMQHALLREISGIMKEEQLPEQAQLLEKLLERCQQPGGREWLLHGALQPKSEA
ncbi:putative glutathione-specific gamma-glutamylcyclotransferase 2 [Drosophila takahashii]|uniref:putative glutathione-specific gamma-glutamylcyclotransferase 2 n=1 Tax=Drosophila takahashii TaxID=29030 RepID=UPI001CF7F4F9|nr:putative glutathione-specific gamma-glutamylcyclotransferase 2 [Drosophila takahashii]